MESAHQAGVTLLDCIHPKQRDGADEWYTPDIKANAAELNEFLEKLKEMENDIEKLWKEQKAMIQYGLEVCLFEREMNQVVCLVNSVFTSPPSLANVEVRGPQMSH